MAGAMAGQAQTADKIKVLVVTGGHPYKAEPFFKLFQDNPEISYAAAEQKDAAEAYDRDDLYSFQVVVLYDAPINITDDQKARFLGLFDRGIGVVILHHAFLSYPMWPEYGRIAGGQYIYKEEQVKDGVTESHVQNNVDIPVTIAAGNHPVTAGLHDFVIQDELYTNMHMIGSVTPLLKTGDEVLGWTRMEKKSRVVGTVLGHGPTAYENPTYIKFVVQSIRWAAGR